MTPTPTCAERLLVATGNAGKRREFETLLSPLLEEGWEVYDRKSYPQKLPEVVEDAPTFAGNAIKKALEPARQTGCCVVSDDSGLVVDALDGRPGVYSARYAGPKATDADNNRLLIEELATVPSGERSARYIAVICLVVSDNAMGRALLARRGLSFGDLAPAPASFDDLLEGQLVRSGDKGVVYFQGSVEGSIIDEARGTGGFGYDPHFYLDPWQQTMAELPLTQKNGISHRAEGARKLVAFFSRETNQES